MSVNALQPSAPNGVAGPRKTPLLQAIDPRVRIVSVVFFALVCVTCQSIPALLAALCISLSLMLLARLPARPTLKRMAAMDGFILFILVLLPFTVPGTAMFTLWGISASWEGLWQAVRIGLTANAVVLAMLALVGTLEPVVMGHALHHLKMPTRLVHLILFTLRYIEVLHQEYNRLRQAMKARGFRPTTSWHCYRSFGYLVGMMLVRALERSERILSAMKCRGFTGHIPLLAEFTLSRRDAVFSIGFTLALLTLIATEAANAV